MEVKAIAKFVRVSPTKMRRLANGIKNLGYEEAVDVLKFEPSPNSELLLKTLESAGANAEENHNLAKDDLYVQNALVDQGPTLKRFRAGSMGRGMRIRKGTSHIKVILTDKKPKGNRG